MIGILIPKFDLDTLRKVSGLMFTHDDVRSYLHKPKLDADSKWVGNEMAQDIGARREACLSR